MGVVLLRRRHHHLPIITGFTLLLLASTSELGNSFQLGGGGGSEREHRKMIRTTTTTTTTTTGSSSFETLDRVWSRRRLGGPGSSPPSCRSKCGRCSPCKPVHVAIQPGLSRPLEYYPEAWRCKCGNKLFMP